MVVVREIVRKGRALGASGLRCLAGVATVNMSAGCAHGCVYCYTQGYRQYPGRGQIVVYANTADQVKEELGRKRKRPGTVYFCPSCDAFQPVKEVLEQTYRSMQILLEAGVRVEFVTKGTVPDQFLSLFRTHAGMVAAQVGLACVDEETAAMLEPGAPSVVGRLETIAALLEVGVEVGVRADPLVHGLSDTDAQFDALVTACAKLGVRELAASYLFLRPAVRAAIVRILGDNAVCDHILRPYGERVQLPIQGSRSCGWALPASVRQNGYERLKRHCQAQGMKLHLCGCKNSDLTADRCHLVHTPKSAEAGAAGLLPFQP